MAVVNREKELQNPANEPFGQSGSRCSLFDPLKEEPYGTELRNPDEVAKFMCAISAREGWRYACMYVYVYVCTYICMYVHVQAGWRYACMYVYMYVHMFVCMCINKHTHTLVQSHAQTRKFFLIFRPSITIFLYIQALCRFKHSLYSNFGNCFGIFSTITSPHIYTTHSPTGTISP
jgi:hypothetical protein